MLHTQWMFSDLPKDTSTSEIKPLTLRFNDRCKAVHLLRSYNVYKVQIYPSAWEMHDMTLDEYILTIYDIISSFNIDWLHLLFPQLETRTDKGHNML